jgi:hypothetical protein
MPFAGEFLGAPGDMGQSPTRIRQFNYLLFLRFPPKWNLCLLDGCRSHGMVIFK